MTPAARLAAAIEALADIEGRRRPVAEALKDWGVSHRFAGSKDRAAIGNLVYDALRWRASTAWAMGEETARALVLGTVARRWGLGAEGLDRTMAGDPHGPAELSDAERERIAGADLAVAPPHVRADIPEWLALRFERVFGADWVAEGEGLATRPPLDMRVNRLKSERDKVLKALAAFGPAPAPFSPDGVRIAPIAGEGRHPNVQAEPGFQKGWFEVQDEGSQLAALIVGAKPGEQVLDLCAGAGGKTLALAAAMANKGQVHATDSDRTRLAPIFERLRRSGARNVQVIGAGAPLDNLDGRMDAVLIDAPCTGTGVWRRRPEAKWRLTERALAERVAEQGPLLDGAIRFLKPGGRLVYVTCSLLPEEDIDQVETLARARPELRILAGAEVLVRAGAADLAEKALALPAGAMLTPRRTGTDGFFVAVLVAH